MRGAPDVAGTLGDWLNCFVATARVASTRAYVQAVESTRQLR